MTDSILRLVDDISVPIQEAHPEPCLLEAGEIVKLGEISSLDVFRATSAHKRFEFTTPGDPRNVVAVSVRATGRGVPGTLVCIADLMRSSSVQLRSPLDTVAIMEVDTAVGHAILTCERIGLARVTAVTEEAVHDDGTWVTSLIYEGRTFDWGADTVQYKVNQQVPIRIPAHGHPVAMM